MVMLQTVSGQQARQYAFTHYTIANGLASNIVNSLAQDEEGYIWLATINGLQRYDGYRFLTFRSSRNVPGSLQHDNLAQLYYDKKFNLWVVATNNKVGIFNTRTFKYKEVPVEGKEKTTFLSVSFLEMPDGTLMMQELHGDSYRYDEKAGKLVLDNQSIPFPKGWRRAKSIWDPQLKKYWTAADSGLILYNPATRALSYRNHNTEQDEIIKHYEKDLNFLYLSTDKQNNLVLFNWPPATSHPYLYSYNKSTHQAEKFNLSDKIGVNYHEIVAFLQQRSGRLWIYGRPFITEWLDDRKTFIPIVNEYRNEQSIKFDNVTTCFEDGERNMWIATDNGLFLFNPDAQVFNNYNLVRPGEKSLKEGPTQAVLHTKEGNILVGCWGIGLYNFDENFSPLPLPASLRPFQDDLSIWDMHQHSLTGNIWLALQQGGVLVYNPKTGKAQKEYPAIFENRTIRQLTEDKMGNLWFGTHNGNIIKWSLKKGGNNITDGYSKVLQTGMIYKMLTDSKGYVWAATLGMGLIKIDPRTDKLVQVFNAREPEGATLINNTPTDILQYNDSMLVVISGGINLININTNFITHITTADGMPSNTAKCVTKDENGNLFLGMASGLCRVNLHKKIFTQYDRRNGITYDNFNPAGAHQLNNGRLFFTTDRNFLVFKPSSLVQVRDTPPDPDFTAFRLANNALLLDSLQKNGKAILKYNNNAVSIEFSVLSFLKQKQPEYYYIMDGLDDEWTKTSGSNVATYNYLPPGHYTFKVKAVNQDGVFSKGMAEMQIIVNPPFWRTWWFYAILILLAIGVLFLIDRERLKRLKELQFVRTQIAGDLHSEINVALNDINLLSEIAKIKADKDIDRSKEYIDQISKKSHGMIESMDDMLWSINPANDSMEKLLLRIREFTEGFKKTHHLDIDVNVDNNISHLVLDMRTRHELLLFYKETLNHVIQHSVCSTIYISLEFNKSRLSLKVLAQCNYSKHDDVAMEKTKDEMYKRADMLNATLDVISDKKSISVMLQMSV